MKASVSVLVFRDDGKFSDYVKQEVDLACVPEQGDVLNFGGMKLTAWAVSIYETRSYSTSNECLVICRVNPKEINRRTAQRKLIECGFKCDSRARRRKAS